MFFEIRAKGENMRFVDQLRKMSEREPKAESENLLADRIRKAKELLLAAAAAKSGSRQAVIFTSTDFDGTIDLSMIQLPPEDDPFASSILRQQYASRTVDDLRGLAAAVRDHFKDEGLNLSLHFEARGTRCHERHLAWDLVASW